MTEEQREKRLTESVRAVMLTEQGRRVLSHFIEDTANRTGRSYISGSTHGTAIEEGRRLTGIMMLDELENVCPDLVATMQIEQINERREERERTEPDSDSDAADTSG